MKQSQIRLGVLVAIASVGAVHAQSTVTLSGVVDTGFQKISSGSALTMTPSRNGTSSWAMSGSEDLGGGLKAIFQIATSFNSDDGTMAANAFGNNGMFIGLSGDFGTVRAGRPAHVLWSNVLSANGTKGVSGYEASSALNVPQNYGVYQENSLQYLSPKFGGFSFQLQWAPSESTNVVRNEGYGVVLRYDDGPLSASFVNYRAPKATAPENESVNQFGLAYDFSVAKVFLTVRDQGGLASDSDNAWVLGLTAPMGSGTVYAQYGKSERPGQDATRLSLGYKYPLSKRTTAYVNLGSANAAANVGGLGRTTAGYGLGITHAF
jgi:predicted porin